MHRTLPAQMCPSPGADVASRRHLRTTAAAGAEGDTNTNTWRGLTSCTSLYICGLVLSASRPPASPSLPTPCYLPRCPLLPLRGRCGQVVLDMGLNKKDVGSGIDDYEWFEFRGDLSTVSP